MYSFDLGLFTDERSFTKYLALLMDDNNQLQKAVPKLEISLKPPYPFNDKHSTFDYTTLGGGGAYWHEDALYTTADGVWLEDEDGLKFKPCFFAKWKNDEWQFLGIYKLGEGDGFRAIPCGNNRFILITYDLANENSSKRKGRPRFALASIPKIDETKPKDKIRIPEVQVDSSISFDQKDLLLRFARTIVMTDKHVIFLSGSTGLYWIFSLEKTSFIKSGNIFKKVTPEMIASGGFDNVVLCANPEKDGTVLISALEEESFTRPSIDINKRMTEFRNAFPEATYEERMKKYIQFRKDFDRENPFMVWYRLYPEEGGRVEKLYEPPEGGTFYREERENDLWVPMSDGSVRMGNPEDMLKKHLEPGKKADPAASSKEEKSQSAAPPSKADTIPPQSVVTDPKKPNAAAQPL